MDLKESIRTIPNFPKPGIMFRDITTLIEDFAAFDEAINQLYDLLKDIQIDAIAGIESRGFIFGAPLALRLGVGLILIRKKGKLPGKVVSEEYELEYGTDKIEVHEGSVTEGMRVLLIDDLLATGGTMKASCRLIEKLGGIVEAIGFVIELPDLKGREKLEGYNCFSLIEFEGD